MTILGTCCGKEYTELTAWVVRSGPHLRAECSECGRFLQFLRQPIDAFLMPFGKHKGRRLVELAATEADYLNWMLNQDWLKDNLRHRIEEALHHRGEHDAQPDSPSRVHL